MTRGVFQGVDVDRQWVMYVPPVTQHPDKSNWLQNHVQTCLGYSCGNRCLHYLCTCLADQSSRASLESANEAVPVLLWYRRSLISPPLHRLVARISSLAIKTGLIPCVYTLTSLVTYVSHVIPNICEFFTFMLGRVYTLSMLFPLIYRDKLFSDGELVKMDSTLPSSITYPSECGMIIIHFCNSLTFQNNGSVKDRKIQPVNPPGVR